MFHRRLPRMRKVGINTTGLTPQRAIPCSRASWTSSGSKGLLLSVRVSIDGIGDVHDQVRNVKSGFDKASRTIEAMQELAERSPHFQFGLASTIFSKNLDDAERISGNGRGRRTSTSSSTCCRFTDNMLHNRDLEETIGFGTAKERSCASSSSIASRRSRS